LKGSEDVQDVRMHVGNEKEHQKSKGKRQEQGQEEIVNTF